MTLDAMKPQDRAPNRTLGGLDYILASSPPLDWVALEHLPWLELWAGLSGGTGLTQVRPRTSINW
jgi:hypothetical protein